VVWRRQAGISSSDVDTDTLMLILDCNGPSQNTERKRKIPTDPIG
jgi:hypothetical protein